MESKIQITKFNSDFTNDFDPPQTSYEFCNHILKGNRFYNSFFTNYTAGIPHKNFFKLKSLLITNKFSANTTKNYFDDFFIKSMNLDWAAVYNPLELSMDSINREGCIFTVAFDDEGTTIAASNHNHNIEIWDMNTKKIRKIINDHKEIVTGIEFFHKNSSMMMSCSLDKTIKLWKDNKNIHTFLDHSDWVRCISLSQDNKYFLSGCVSSIVKLWDLEKNKVIKSITNRNPDPDLLNTVNSLSFMNGNENVFLCGLRNGVVKIFDIRAGEGLNDHTSSDCCLVKEFKAHRTKLNSVKFNKEDKYLLSSGRDSSARLWDIRKLNVNNPDNSNIFVNKTNEIAEINEYKEHKCNGYNIETNFFVNEKYVITGSEDSYIYIYDTLSGNLVTKYKTHQKCVNLVKPLPNCQPYSFVFTGLEDISIYVWRIDNTLGKFVEKANALKRNEKGTESDYDKLMKSSENDSSRPDTMKLFEDIMSECGDMILRIFHSNNLTYSNGMNFENLIEILQNNNDQASLELMNSLYEKFMKKLIESLAGGMKSKQENKEKKIKHCTDDTKISKKKILCSACKESKLERRGYKYDYHEEDCSAEDETFLWRKNIVDDEILSMPNEYNCFTGEDSKQIENSNLIEIPHIISFYSNENDLINYKYDYILNQLN